MKTDYFGHDKAYKSRKNEGMPGWDSASQIKKNIATLENLFQDEGVPKKGKLLELGCGAGNSTLWLAEKGYDVSGVDISPTAIDWAREKALEKNMKAVFQVGNVVDLKEYSNDFFDIVLDGHCFHCIIGEDRKQFLKNAGRVLKPGGVFLIMSMCGEITDDLIQKHYDPETRCLIRGGTAIRYLGLAEDILEEIKAANFQILHWEIKTSAAQADQGELLVVASKE